MRNHPTKEGFSSHWTNTLHNENGQSAIEFILTFAFALGLTFIFISQAVNMTEGYLVHYANFMASRTYLVQERAGDNDADASFNFAGNRAREVFDSYSLGDFDIDAEFQFFKPTPQGQNSAVFTGTTARFQKRISPLAFVGGTTEVTLLTESFLGKEPTRSTCYEMVCRAITGNRQACLTSDTSIDVTLYDNGC